MSAGFGEDLHAHKNGIFLLPANMLVNDRSSGRTAKALLRSNAARYKNVKCFKGEMHSRQ